ncbi:hypothetical protein [Salinisphaera sp. T31B1]|uniref:hypothetical protein n=1 Tax=Salinisphaera sp. T31B1 TaxID=727963 RepID=UPI00333FD423
MDILGSNHPTYEIQTFPRRSLLRDVPNPMFYRLEADMNVELDDLLHGSLSPLTSDDQFDMRAGSGGLWTIDHFNSDAAPENCFYGHGRCGGSTGRWVLSDAAIGVPEPQSQLLTGLACIAAFGVRGTGVPDSRLQHGAPGESDDECSKTINQLNLEGC